MNLAEQIKMHCPWHYSPNWMELDPHLTRARQSGIQFRHFPDQPAFECDTISIIRGPRQVGKSTECKWLVKDALDRGEKPGSVVYFPCDNLIDRREIVEVLRTAESLCEGEPNGLTLILDEITSVKDWPRTIKWMKDAGMLKGVKLILTGSSAYEMRRGYERMPGRREGGHDFCLMPMSFREYVRMMTGLTIGSPNVSDVISSEAAFANFRMRCLEEESRIRSCLDHYLLSGGIPRIVAEIKRSKEVGVDATNTYLSAISSEIEKQKRSTAILRAVLTGVYETMASPVSYTRLAQTQHLSGPATARDHLDLLHASFICFAVAPLDISHKTVFPKKDRKYYFSDPIYTMAIQRAFSLPSPAIGAYAEAAVGCWLMRRFAPTWAHWGHVDSLYYWKSSSGHEVDFVLDVDGAYRGIEVKYQTAVSGWDEQSLKRGIGRGILATRNDFAFGDIPRIPLWALLLTFA